MDFLELTKKRYSCRNFSDKKVEKEKLEKILEAEDLLLLVVIINHKEY